MMKRFWTTVLGSFVGVWLGLTVFSILSVVMSFVFIGAMSSLGSSSQNKAVEKSSILKIDLSGTLSERGSEDVIGSLMGKESSDASLSQLLKAIAAAKDNENVTGIYLKCGGLQAGISSLYDLRVALNDFKKSGKFIYAYGYEGIGQGDYYVASVADSLFINPVGMVDIHGLSSMTPYFKSLLDKVGVEMQVIRVGTFKSAVEPYMVYEMSEANRMQQTHYMGSIWANLTDSIAKSRKGLTVAKINEFADSLNMLQEGEFFVKNNLVDGLCYKHEMEAKLKTKVGIEKDENLKIVSASDVLAAAKAPKSSKNKIAVFYAEGEIDGSDEEGIVTEDLSKDIIDAAKDDDVKAVVLRVNSPGGSAFGSEQVWKAFEEVKKAKKPFAVSMGDYAASGGYYISCGADRIFATPVTITGSIGIFGVVPCFEGLATDKLGVKFEEVSTNPGTNISLMKRMTPFQRAKMQGMVNAGYELFTSRCAAGRKVSQDSIKSIAEGRVWDGASAKKIGLVDEYGNLESAIKWVAKKANISGDYETTEYPEVEDKMMKYLSKYLDMKMSEMLKENTGELYQYHDVIKRILGRDQIQCLMEPVEIKLN